jgi:hypothetical protein
MLREIRLWGTERTLGELLELGFAVAIAQVSKIQLSCSSTQGASANPGDLLKQSGHGIMGMRSCDSH